MSLASATPAAAVPHIVRSDSRNLGGRPRGADPASERSLEPWRMIGVSQRTYYRNKKAALKTPPQHGAHVTAWFRTLSGIARLEHRARVRRDLMASRRASSKPQNGAQLLKAYALLRRVH